MCQMIKGGLPPARQNMGARPWALHRRILPAYLATSVGVYELGNFAAHPIGHVSFITGP